MDAIVLAGGIPQSEESIYSLTRGGYKCMLNLAGKPMVQWVLDAIGESRSVSRVVLIGLPLETNLSCAKPIVNLPNQGDFLRNIHLAAVELARENPPSQQVLLVAGDLPGIKAEMIDWFIETIQNDEMDIHSTVVERSVMEKRFPNSRRTFIRFKDAEVCGGDISALRLSLLASENPLWQDWIESRKNPLKQASLVGYDPAFIVLIQEFPLETAARAFSARLGFRARVIRSPYAEVALDVDKPYQFEILKEILSKR